MHLIKAIFDWGDLEIEELDAKIVFLHDDLEEEIYVEQPKGSKVKGN